MVRSCYLVGNPMTFQELLKLMVDEVLPAVAYHRSRHTEARENYVVEEALDGVGVGFWSCHRFHPLRNVIDGH